MDNNDFVPAVQSLIKKMDNEPSDSVAYALLAEMAKMVDAEQDKLPPDDALACYLYLGDNYCHLRHYLFALEYYRKALAAATRCGDNIAADERLQEQLEEGFVNMFDMYTKMGREKEAEELLSIVAKVLPSALDTVKKERKSRTKCDPVEYTERYMTILPELEAKIEAQLEGIPRTRGFCHQYWHAKGEILKRDYGIDWDSPAALNPRIRFD